MMGGDLYIVFNHFVIAMKDELNSQLLTLANHQILQDTFTSDIGLFSGKMGRALCSFL